MVYSSFINVNVDVMNISMCGNELWTLAPMSVNRLRWYKIVNYESHVRCYGIVMK